MATLTVAIVDDEDDGFFREDAGGIWDSRVYEGNPQGERFDISYGGGGDTRWGSLRFQNVTVPAGATINSATLTLTLSAVNNIDATNSIITVRADVGANRQTALSATHHSELNWTDSTASVNYAGLAVGAEVITVTSIIQELVNLGGWASGDEVCLSLDPSNSPDTYWYVLVADYDADTTATVASLFIDYTAAGVAAAPKQSLIASTAVKRAAFH